MSEESSVRSVAAPVLRDAGVVLAWFVVSAVVAAVVWWQVTPLPVFTRTHTGAEMNPVQLGKRVAVDGWYFVLAVGFGVVSGVVLTAWRRRDPIFTVLLVACGAGLAGWLAARLGLWLGPASPKEVLGRLAAGQHAPVQLALSAQGAQLVWPMAALLGAVGVLWGTAADNR
ncbi:MAG TPA: hypothetical protein VFL99_16205 [Segeticoccus sp.]|uniref:hypothetical protein n=1 Tax=Segeticoccus sp. TaxID=2706531 RepID=UPI002D7F0FEC|nr:hypothetical protein [Segeticoccus sp.]HET8601868.1 hypothetical protein [Segeticoccus sp.]